LYNEKGSITKGRKADRVCARISTRIIYTPSPGGHFFKLYHDGRHLSKDAEFGEGLLPLPVLGYSFPVVRTRSI
jgi:hypothetical protein